MPGENNDLAGERTSNEERLQKDLRATVLESYELLSGGYDEAYLDGLARDRRLLIIDTMPEDLVVGFSSAACDVWRRLSGERREIVSKALTINLSADRTMAWTYDELSYRVVRQGRRLFIPLRATAVYEHRSGRWLLVQQHISYGMPIDWIVSAAAAGTLPNPARLRSRISTGSAAAEIKDVLLAVLSDTNHEWSRYQSTEDDAWFIGVDPEQEYRGSSLAGRHPVDTMFGEKMAVQVDGIRIQLNRSGSVAWAAANLFAIGDASGWPLRIPLRATWVLERRSGGWQIVQTHFSVAMSRKELETQVLR
ncbi:MAG: nuclear transport factor 2 family protein [Pseudomonadota bacterium]